MAGKSGKAPSAHNWDTHMVLMLSSRNFMSDVGLSRALVCWYRYVLLADPPPWTPFAHTHANTRSTQDVGKKREGERGAIARCQRPHLGDEEELVLGPRRGVQLDLRQEGRTFITTAP